MDKICVLAECIERDIQMMRQPSLQEAQQTMFDCYMETVLGSKEAFQNSDYANKKFPDCLEEIQKDPEVFGEGYAEITAMWAYVNDGPNHDNYDWKIEEL